jgi:hypothetical protein
MSVSESNKKTCGKCREEKPLEAFASRHNTPDKRQVWCRNCASGYHRTNRDQMRRRRERRREAAHEIQCTLRRRAMATEGGA